MKLFFQQAFKIEFKTILITTAILVAIFSITMLIKINGLNHWIYKECESRNYVDWVKEEKIPLTSPRTLALRAEIEKSKNEMAKCENIRKPLEGRVYDEIFGERGGQKFCGLFQSDEIKKKEEFLEQGYEIKRVPDEEKRAKSREEVEDYKECLKKQELAEQKRPENYKLLIIGNVLVIVIGTLIASAFYKKK